MTTNKPTSAVADTGKNCMGCVHVCFMVINVLFQGFLRMMMRVNGGSGYNHPSPSIPLPIEGRGKPVATWLGILGALAASVTDQTYK